MAVEWNLTLFRVGMAALLLAAELAAAPFGPADVVTVVYGAFAAGVALRRSKRPCTTALCKSVVAIDVATAACLTVIGRQPLVHFFPLFVLVAVAYRAGLKATVLSGGLLACSLALETHPAVEAAVGQRAPSHILILGGYTLVVALLVGYLAKRERGARSESAAIGRLFEQMRLDAGPLAGLRTVLDELRGVFAARRVVMAVDDLEGEVSLVWETRDRDDLTQRGPTARRLQWAERPRYWFPVAPGAAACLVVPSVTARRAAAAIDHSGSEVSSPAIDLRAFLDAHPASQLFVLPFWEIGRFRLRLFVLDPPVERADEELRLLRTLVHRVAPVVNNVFLERHLRIRLKEDERARLARELHDGVIQALIGVEMRLDVARRQVHSAPVHAAADLVEAQGQLRAQIVDVRTLMNQLRRPEVDHRRLVQHLSDTTERFHRRTGIVARFDRAGDEVELPTRVCSELARVVDEALVNVHKHSGARHVDVHLGASADGVTLSIEDDGRGFGFAGRMTQPDLDALGLGPVVIKERVQALGGSVAIDSRPGRGARLEVQLPTPAVG